MVLSKLSWSEYCRYVIISMHSLSKSLPTMAREKVAVGKKFLRMIRCSSGLNPVIRVAEFSALCQNYEQSASYLRPC